MTGVIDTTREAEELAQTSVGDAAFLGVDMRTDPSALAPGMVSLGVNTRFERGVIQPRGGTRVLPHRVGEWFPLTFNLNFDQVLPYERVWGVAVFDDPNDMEWVVVVASAGGQAQCYAVRENAFAQSVPLPVGVSIEGPVYMVQGVSKLVMCRGEGQSYLTLEDVEVGWVEEDFEQVTGEDGTTALPGSSWALFLQNRLLTIVNRDEVAWSEVLDLTRHVVTNAGRINKGTSDRLVGLYAFNDFTVVAAKERSLYAVTNLVPDASGAFSSARLDTITTDFGVIAPKSVIHTGNDLIGLSRRGLISIRQTETNALQGVDMPLSDAIQPLIDRINWRHAHKAVSAKWRNRGYFAVPIDAAEVLRDELVLGLGYTYSGAGAASLGTLQQGSSYRLRFGANDTAAVVRKLVVSSITRSGTTATATVADDEHPFSTGDQVTVEGAGQAEYNGTFSVTRVSDRVFSYTVSGSPATPATGTLRCYRPAWRFLKSQAVQFDWEAADAQVYLEGTNSAAVTASVRPVFRGVNNAVAVFNFLTRRWEGYDVGDGLMVADWLTRTIQGEERLTFVSADGFEWLYEDGFDDHVALHTWRPWVEVRVGQSPRPGQSIQVNGGTTVTAALADRNTSTTWGARNFKRGLENFLAGWLDGVWTASGVVVSEVSGGVRFTSTSSTAPTVTLVGDWYERTVCDDHAIVKRAIRMEVLTRGYRAGGPRRWVGAELQLATHRPRYSVTAETDGAEESVSVVADQVRDRRRYHAHNRDAFDTSNVNGDHGDPFREDYSVVTFD